VLALIAAPRARQGVPVGSFLSFRSVSTKESYQTGPPRAPAPIKRFNVGVVQAVYLDRA
jgi:hypothetical protein